MSRGSRVRSPPGVFSACSVMVIIDASQALDPGSIPGRRNHRAFVFVVPAGEKKWMHNSEFPPMYAHVAQLGERQTEDLKVSSSILGLGMFPPAPAPRVGLGGRDFSFRA